MLVIAEKPKAASKIARALGLRKRGRLYGIPYWVGSFNGRKFVVVPTAGHMFSLHTGVRGFPVFNYRWVPRWVSEPSSKHLIKFYRAIKRLASRATYFINACDYDIEGSVIGFLIIKFLGDLKKAGRVKFSSLVSEELRSAFRKVGGLDWSMVEAGLCRHELDWIWGINISRALMHIFRHYGNSKTRLSAGRVQSPTLTEVLRRHVEKEVFIPEPYYTLNVEVTIDGKVLTLNNLFPPFKKLGEVRARAEALRNLGFLKVLNKFRSVKSLNPPPPFNLPDMQVEASRIHGLAPAETLRLAEELYLDTLISYPRTNSQKLPPGMNWRNIIGNLGKVGQYSGYVKELLREGLLTPREGVKEDPAHPAIYPTGYLPKDLTGKKGKLYDLIVRRFLACFGRPARVISTKYEIAGGGLRFSLESRKVDEQGWLKIYPYIEIKVSEVPELQVGDLLPVKRVKIIKTYSRPPQLYTRVTLLKWMESVNIGTESTRAEIIEVLFKRGYLRNRGKYVDVTELGEVVSRILSEMFSEVTSVNLTRDFEEKLRGIMSGRLSRSEVIAEAINVLEPRLLVVKEGVNEEKVKRLVNVEPARKCDLCWRPAEGEFKGRKLCYVHKLAVDNVLKYYKVWREREGISWGEYLRELRKLNSVGKYCKEVVGILM